MPCSWMLGCYDECRRNTGDGRLDDAVVGYGINIKNIEEDDLGVEPIIVDLD
jgi:hypothetical protein